MIKFTCQSTGIPFEHLRESQQFTGAFPIEISATKRWFPHISPASLDQEIITGLLKPLKLRPGTYTVLLYECQRGAESPECAPLHPPLWASMRPEQPSSHRNSAGLLGWRAWISSLPPCLWLLFYVIQPECLPEAQMMQALWRRGFVPMEYRNLHYFNKDFLSIYSAPGAIPGTGFIPLVDYLLVLNSYHAVGTGLKCHSLQGGPGLVKGLFIISDVPLFSQLRRAGRTRQGSWLSWWVKGISIVSQWL